MIGVLFKWLFPALPWPLAFAFGAIVSPPDAVAATTIFKRFAIGTRLLTVLEGESLINDASALVLYRLAVTALLSGIFSFSAAGLEFIKIVPGGVAVGLVLGTVIQPLARRYLDPVVGLILSFTIPYITYILADTLGVSGVLAVVVNGLIGSHILLTQHTPLRRVLGWVVWDMFIIILNCFVFILIGLQLRTLTSMMTIKQMVLYTEYALLITVAMFAARMIWVCVRNGVSYFKALNSSNSPLCYQILYDAALIGCSGMRGIVSLAAALALPVTLSDGMPLEGRNEVIFITFVVILMTLLIPGLTLSFLIRWLKIHHPSMHHELHKIRKQLVKTAEEKIHNLHTLQSINEEELDFLKSYFNLKRRVLENSTSPHKKLQNLESARLNIIQTQRKQLLEMWERHEVDDKQLSHLEHELDVEELWSIRAEIK